MQAPKGMSSASGIVVTPLSTLYAISGETNLASFATKLGLSGKDLATKDPMADKELLQAAITSQQLIVQTKKYYSNFLVVWAAHLQPNKQKPV